MKYLIVIFLAQITQSAMAASHFDDLYALYETAAQPTLVDVTGIWSGRCFEKDLDRPIATAFGFFEVIENAGPHFPVETFYSVAFLFDKYGKADSFDAWTSADIVSKSGRQLEKYEMTGQSLLVPDESIFIRKYGPYLLINNKNGLGSMCYYFNKLL